MEPNKVIGTVVTSRKYVEVNPNSWFKVKIEISAAQKPSDMKEGQLAAGFIGTVTPYMIIKLDESDESIPNEIESKSLSFSPISIRYNMGEREPEMVKALGAQTSNEGTGIPRSLVMGNNNRIRYSTFFGRNGNLHNLIVALWKEKVGWNDEMRDEVEKIYRDNIERGRAQQADNVNAINSKLASGDLSSLELK